MRIASAGEMRMEAYVRAMLHLESTFGLDENMRSIYHGVTG